MLNESGDIKITRGYVPLVLFYVKSTSKMQIVCVVNGMVK